MTDATANIPSSRYRIASGTTVDLTAHHSADIGPYAKKKPARRDAAALAGRLDSLQRLLWADGRHKLLVVLQAMDAGGKDGTIRKVFGGLNPQGVTVTGFTQPTTRELGHDYLCRVHRHTPGAGKISVFNRSHYEDVLIVRVLDLVPEVQWRRRYRHINEFERVLAEEGTTILKFFLHVSKDEQRQRLQARLDNPEKIWKFSAGDLAQREKWDAYMAAYAEMLGRTSTEAAPWYVVPADHKWYRDVVVASVVAETLESMGLSYPAPEAGLEGVVVP